MESVGGDSRESHQVILALEPPQRALPMRPLSPQGTPVRTHLLTGALGGHAQGRKWVAQGGNSSSHTESGLTLVPLPCIPGLAELECCWLGWGLQQHLNLLQYGHHSLAPARTSWSDLLPEGRGDRVGLLRPTEDDPRP